MTFSSFPLLLASGLLALTSCSSLQERPPEIGTATQTLPEADLLLNQARQAQAQGDQSKALKLFKKTAKSYPLTESGSLAQYEYASLLYSEGKVTDAFDAYQKFIESNQTSNLYSKALKRQSDVAFASSKGEVKHRFLGLSSKVATGKVISMLETVRENAPQALSAEKAQFEIGKIHRSSGKHSESVKAFNKLVSEQPNSTLAPQAQYLIGLSLLEQAQNGNQNQANRDAARRAFEDLIQVYPNSNYVGKARQKITQIESGDIQSNYDVAEFYRKKGQVNSARYYYGEVIRLGKGSPLSKKAQDSLNSLPAQ